MDCKKLILLVLAVLLLAGIVTVSAESDDSSAEETVADNATGNCTWSLTGTELTIQAVDGKDGKMADYSRAVGPWGNSITKVTIGAGVTYIGNYAFYNCRSLESVTFEEGSKLNEIGTFAFYYATFPSITFPNSLKSIGEYAFSNATSDSLVLPDSVETVGGYLFNYSKIPSITLSKSITEISYHMFWGSTVKTVEIPAKVKSIGEAAFQYCSNLTAVTIAEGSNLETIGKNAFMNLSKLESISSIGTVKTIESGAFSGCTKLANVTLGADISSIGSSAFQNCSSLGNVTLGSKLTVIESGTFSGCAAFTSIAIPDSVAELESAAFSGCTSLKTVSLGSGLTNLGTSAFSGCTALETVSFDKDAKITSIGTSVFNTCGFLSFTIPDTVETIGKNAFAKCTSLASVTLGAKVSSIDNTAFSGCSALTAFSVVSANENYSSLDGVLANKEETTLILWPAGKSVQSYTVPDSVTIISEGMFQGNNILKEVRFGANTETIGASAFAKCSALESIVFSESVTTVGDSAFNGCTALKTVVLGDGITALGTRVFAKCTALEEVTIGKSLETIGVRMFQECTSLETVNFGEKVNAIGDFAFESSGLKTVSIPDSITVLGTDAFSNCKSLLSLTIGAGIKSISVRAFSGCSALFKVTIPSNVETIEANAFGSCLSLDMITFSAGLKTIGKQAFMDCRSIRLLSLPNTLIEIGEEAFSKCTKLGNYVAGENSSLGNMLYFPANVTTIGDKAFYGCTNLGSVQFNSKLETIGKQAFSGCVNLTGTGITSTWGRSTYTWLAIPNSVTSIGENAFENCASLAGVSIGTGITDIPNGLFRGCLSLGKAPYAPGGSNSAVGGTVGVQIGGHVKSIGNYAFQDCASLKTLSLPSSVASIGNYAFQNCAQLSAVSFPDSVTSIGQYAFQNCASLQEISLPEGITSINQRTFDGCAGLRSVSLPSTLVTIGNYAFNNCSALTGIEFGNNVTSIGASSFNGCASLISVTIPNSVTNIGNYAFSDCSNLENLILGDGVESLGDSIIRRTNVSSLIIPDKVTYAAFYACPNLETVHLGKSVAKVGSIYSCPMLRSITVDPENENLVSVDGILFSKDMKTLYCYPAQKEGKSYTVPDTVTAIQDYAFAYSAYLESLVVSESVGSIGSNTFLTMAALKEISLGSKITKNLSLLSCTSLEKISVSADNTNYTSVDGVLFNKNVTNLMVYPSCKTSETYTVPDSVTTIQFAAFLHAKYLRVLNIGSAVATYTTGSLDILSGCSSLEEINVSADNTKFSSVDGVLFNKDKTWIYAFPVGKDLITYTVPDTVTKIGASSFQNSKLVSVIISDNVDRVNNDAFKDCINLQTVYIGKGVKVLSSNSFYGCDKLSKVVFSGSLNSMNLTGSYAAFSVDLCDAEGNKIAALTDLTESTFVGSDGKLLKTADTVYTVTYTDANGKMLKTADNVKTAVDESVTPAVADIPGYTSPQAVTVKIGSTENVVNYVYTVKQYEYTVKYVDENGSTIKDTFTATADYGTEVSPEVPLIENYIAVSEAQTLTVSDDASKNVVTYVYAVDPAATVSIVYQVDGETVFTDTAKRNTEVTVRGVYEKTGYTVSGWTTSDAEVSGGKFIVPMNGATFSATSSVNQYDVTVEYVDSDGKAIRESLTFKADYGSKLILDISPIVGYTAPSDVQELIVSDKAADNKVTYRYTVISYTVTVSGEGVAVRNGDTLVESGAVVPYGTVLTAAIADRTGYTGTLSVSSGVLGADGSCTVASDVTIAGTYTVNQYTIVFNTAGGSDVASITQDYGSEVTAPADPVREGYTFSKWTPSVPTTMPAQNVTLVAEWILSPAPNQNGEASVTIIPVEGTKTVTVNFNDSTSVEIEDASDLVGKTVYSKIVAIDNTSTLLGGEAYDFFMTVDDAQYRGKMLVTLPYEKEDGKQAAVYYNDNGVLTKMNVVSTTDTSVTFETDHNSQYIVVSEDAESDDDDTALILGLVCAAVIILLVAGIFVYRSRKA